MARRKQEVAWADPALLILGSLVSGPKHGYAIVQETEQDTGITLGPGTLYAALARLEERGQVRALPGDERRPAVRDHCRRIEGAGRAARSDADVRGARPGPAEGAARMSRLTSLALRAYPPSFRARYGAEMAALMEDLPTSARTTANLFGGAVRAWVRPSFTGRTALPQRLQASAATTWVGLVRRVLRGAGDDQGAAGPTTERPRRWNRGH